MFCPECRDEYRAGYTRCNDCGVDLVEKLPDPAEPPPADLVTVLETGDQSLIAIAKSVFDGAGISYIARNERLQNLFGWGTIGTGYNVAMGPIRLQVLPQDAEVARELLAAHAPPESEDGDA